MTAILKATSLHQLPGDPTGICEHLRSLLNRPRLLRVRISVAYARWDGLGLISEQLESFLSSGGELQTIYGVANGITTPDSLLYGLYLQKLYTTHTYAGAVEDEFCNSIFHPKFYEFRFEDCTIAIIGSANLTAGGFLRNTEIVIQTQAARGDALELDLDKAWLAFEGKSTAVTTDLVRQLSNSKSLASEADEEERSHIRKPRLPNRIATASKPLFSKILALAQPAQRSKILSQMDRLSQRPLKLYLQILANETGGGGDRIGYQVQLPVATLASYFGIGQSESKDVTFAFGAITTTVKLTHFGNNTHRVRLLPLRDVPRPTIVIFERISDRHYNCTIVPTSQYDSVLKAKCKEQTRAGARRWGLE